jgi:hypothetical protein
LKEEDGGEEGDDVVLYQDEAGRVANKKKLNMA